MDNYPREISIDDGKMRHTQDTHNEYVIKKVKPSRNLTIHLYQSERSYHQLSREYTEVDIRNNGAQISNFLVVHNGQLRPAISEVEGLDRFAIKDSFEDTSISNSFRKRQDYDLEIKDELSKIPTESYNSLSTDISSKERRISTLKNRSSWTKFDQLCYDFDKRSVHRNETRTGKRLGFYRFILDIGRGNFSKVKLAFHSLLNIEVAVKVIDRTRFDEKTRRLLSQELINMEKLNHPHIIRVYEVHEVVQRWHLVMEYAPKGELNTYLKKWGRLDEKTAKSYSSQILSALEHIHKKGIVHRDLKAENVFIVSSSFIKVGDFGFSKSISQNDALTTFCGSPSYAAPELFVADFYSGPAVDLWAFGVLLFYMVNGYLPFRSDNLHKIKCLILSGEYQIPAHVPETCRTLISGLLCGSVERRYNIYQVKHCAWLSDVDWSRLETHCEATPDEIDDCLVRSLLKKWWSVEDWELDRAIKDGPRNKLTGIYRILHTKGLKFKKNPNLPGSNKCSNKRSRVKRNTSNGSGRNKPRHIALSRKELTTVDLRDNKTMKGKVDNDGETTTRACYII